MTFLHYWDYEYLTKISKKVKDEKRGKSNKGRKNRKTIN